MKKAIITIVVLFIKAILINLLLNYCLEIYDKKSGFINQNIIIWIFLYLPFFMGCEIIINLIFDKKK